MSGFVEAFLAARNQSYSYHTAAAPNDTCRPRDETYGRLVNAYATITARNAEIDRLRTLLEAERVKAAKAKADLKAKDALIAAKDRDIEARKRCECDLRNLSLMVVGGYQAAVFTLIDALPQDAPILQPTTSLSTCATNAGQPMDGVEAAYAEGFHSVAAKRGVKDPHFRRGW